MRKFYLTFLFAFLYAFPKPALAQSCNILGCAASYGPITAITTVPGETGFGSCYYNVVYKQAYWEFFYSPNGGNFEQTFTPVNAGGDPLDIDYSVYDMGITGPSGMTCPVNVSGFTEVICELTPTHGNPTGPGINGTVPTLAGHYYAVIIYVYQYADPSYTFNVEAPTLNGQPFSALNCPGVLPVKLNNFSAQSNGCKVKLNWQSQFEQNLSKYLVEESLDGRTFIPIGTVNSSNETWGSNYSFETLPTAEKTFYRLKMMDWDGRYAYSNITSSHTSCRQKEFLIYPNPVKDLLHIEKNIPGNYSIQYAIYNALGNEINKGTIKGETGNVSFSNLPGGVYILRITQNGNSRQYKIIH